MSGFNFLKKNYSPFLDFLDFEGFLVSVFSTLTSFLTLALISLAVIFSSTAGFG